MGVTSKPNPVRSIVFLVLLLIVAGASTLAYFKQQERLAQERLSEALVLSNRRIGMSLDELWALTEQIGSNSEIGISNAREAVFWIVCSGKFLRADHLLAVWRVRHDHHDHVRLRQHLPQFAGRIHPVDMGDRRRRVLHPDHPHPKRRTQPRRLGPNLPQPDDSHRLPL